MILAAAFGLGLACHPGEAEPGGTSPALPGSPSAGSGTSGPGARPGAGGPASGEPATGELELAAAFVHAPATSLSPALTELGPGDAPMTGARLTDTDTCASCHEEIAAQWRTSAHAFASFNNPIYRASVARFRDHSSATATSHGNNNGNNNSRFCAGCHDPALLVDGAMDQEVAATDTRAHVGVGCLSCHGVESSTPDGNGSYVLAAGEVPLPEPDDTRSLARHRAAMGPARDQCGACHRAFIGVASGHPHHLGGTDELGPWRDSSYAGNKLRLDTPVTERDCADCHMPQEVVAEGSDPARGADGQLRSHRFLGGHSWLAAMRNDPQTLARVQDFLTGVASLDIAAVGVGGSGETGVRTLLGQGFDGETRGRVVFDLVVRNLAVGHRFPGGTRDAQDTWIAVRVLDGQGRVVAQLDEGHGSVHRLRTGVVDEHGKLVGAREVEALRAVAFDQTVGPRDAVVVRYALELPADAPGPLRVEARLLHRSRTLELADETCRAAKTPDGRAFLRATERLTATRLDPCAALPVTEIARHELILGGDSSDPRPDHERLWELGMALAHQVQERLPEAREALLAAERALDRAELGVGVARSEDAAARARILALLGAVAAHQGRVDEALALADRVESLAPGHPYPELLRGRALAKVWRWDAAIPHLERARSASPSAPSLAAELAVAYGSAGRHREALAVAAEALALRPRDATLLRAQALALQALEQPEAVVALDAYFAHREPDDQPHLAAACGERDPACARERVPVHVHE